MDLKNFASQIHSTGFPLEHRIAVSLRKAGWSVVANKYYVDDLEDTVREVDLVAYRVRSVLHFSVHTTLIISCKKSEKNAWVLLSRQPGAQHLSTGTEPFHSWSNVHALSHMTSLADWPTNYYREARDRRGCAALAQIDRDIFAFQEMDRTSGRPQNDKAIFSAITSLMKAQAYELGALRKNSTAFAFYQFNLISIVDSPLVRLDFDDTSPDPVPNLIDSEFYLARYIVNKEQAFARIHFSTADRFESLIPDYEKLHDVNCELLSAADETFFEDIFSDPARWRSLAEEFRSAIDFDMFLASPSGKRSLGEMPVPSFRLDDDKLLLELNATEREVVAFNTDDALREATVTALRRLYRYDGPFEFVSDGIEDMVDQMVGSLP